MRLGTETISMTNYLMSGTKGQPVPAAGIGATILMWSDRRACTIHSVLLFKTGKRKGQIRTVAVQRDTVTRLDNNGFSESQEYSYAPNPKAPLEVFKVNKSGAYRGYLGQLRVGNRDEYHDYSF